VSHLAKFEHLLGTPYEDGRNDCYGLLRQYYAEAYGLKLRNYARPIDFAQHLNLITENFSNEGFLIVDISLDQLELGDVLLFGLNRPKYVNHIGAYVGNGWMIHHLYQRPSSKDALTSSWRQRVVSVVRHPDVADQNKLLTPQINFAELLSPMMKAKYEIPQ
jgi:cell wall-associated NlpC family hydrolase